MGKPEIKGRAYPRTKLSGAMPERGFIGAIDGVTLDARAVLQIKTYLMQRLSSA